MADCSEPREEEEKPYGQTAGVDDVALTLRLSKCISAASGFCAVAASAFVGDAEKPKGQAGGFVEGGFAWVLLLLEGADVAGLECPKGQPRAGFTSADSFLVQVLSPFESFTFAMSLKGHVTEEGVTMWEGFVDILSTILLSSAFAALWNGQPMDGTEPVSRLHSPDFSVPSYSRDSSTPVLILSVAVLLASA